MTDSHGFELTPVDIRGQQFRKVILGYVPDEVEDFKERLAQEMERHIREKAQLEDRLTGFREQLKAFREREKAMNDALVAAQALKSQMAEAAQRESDLTVREAGLEADKIVERARAAEASIGGDIVTLQRQFATYVAAFRRLLERQMAEVDAISQYERDGTIPDGPRAETDHKPEDDDDY